MGLPTPPGGNGRIVGRSLAEEVPGGIEVEVDEGHVMDDVVV